MGSGLENHAKVLSSEERTGLERDRIQGWWRRLPDILLKNRTLALSGYHVDVIAETGPALFNASSQAHGGTLDEMHHLANNYDACWDLFERSRYLSNSYPHAAPGQTLDEAFKRTLFLDIKKISFQPFGRGVLRFITSMGRLLQILP